MLSIVIPAFNEEKNVSKCLDALCRQSTDQKFEVILVDNNSTDNTVGMAKEFSEKLNLKIVKQEKKGRSPARKKGFDVARGEIIFSTDADIVVPYNWIHEMVSCFEDENIVAVTGRCYIDDCNWLTNKIFNTFHPLAMHLYRVFFGHYWLNGFSFAVRASVYTKSGGFDSELNVQEDVDLAIKLSKLGKIEFLGKAPVHFSGRRFNQHGLLKGLWPYLKSFRFYRQGNKAEAYLSDVR
ncbi:MAG: glycosyltransferase [Patescibacteria group bacterium]